MLSVFTEIVLPVLAVVALGAVVGRWRRIPPQPLASLVLYLLAPALVFDALSSTDLSVDVGIRVTTVVIITLAVMAAMSIGWSRLRGHDPAMRSGFALVATSPNFGNMGLAVATLAFGDLGLEVAVLTFFLGAVLANTVGVAIGSMVAGASWRRVLVAPLRYPFIYAATAGIVVNAFAIGLPIAIAEPITILARAAIPVMLVVLGLQLREGLGPDFHLDLAAATTGRLILAPAIAWVAGSAIGLDGVARATLVTVAAMPAAVITTVLAAEFDAKPAFVTRAVVLTTLVSALTLTVLIDLVR